MAHVQLRMCYLSLSRREHEALGSEAMHQQRRCRMLFWVSAGSDMYRPVCTDLYVQTCMYRPVCTDLYVQTCMYRPLCTDLYVLLTPYIQPVPAQTGTYSLCTIVFPPSPLPHNITACNGREPNRPCAPANGIIHVESKSLSSYELSYPTSKTQNLNITKDS
jgi:hypothetical protein